MDVIQNQGFWGKCCFTVDFPGELIILSGFSFSNNMTMLSKNCLHLSLDIICSERKEV